MYHGPIWFDDKETYRFLRDNYKDIPRIKSHIGRIKPYILTPEVTRMEERKKRIRSLASLMGNEYAQKILYFHLCLDRFLRLAMPINRLSSLLSETFFYFERYLYMPLAWDKDTPGFYRDHSLHAAHEAFLGYQLLKNFPNLEQKIKDFFKQNNDITRYINDNCRIGLTSERDLRQIIYRTWFLSALFHDLGYVLCFNRDIREKMLSFHRHSDLILRADKSSFDDIQLLLGNSLLFNTVKTENLEAGYNQNRHGTLSAFLLLATFYSPPAFDGVDLLDRAAIELAAHAIYCHDCGEEEAVKLKSLKAAKSPFGKYAGYFKKETLSKNIEDLLIKQNIKNIKTFKIEIPIENKQQIKRSAFNKSPFSFYLRFIDKLHVFGRNSLSFTTDQKKVEEMVSFEESGYSYSMPFIRNLVLFPAQLAECLDNKLRIYYIADASLYYQEWKGKSNPHFDYGYTCFNDEAVGKFLTELYWLKRNVKASELFDDLEIFFIEILPNAK
jgi:hypothetical protein